MPAAVAECKSDRVRVVVTGGLGFIGRALARCVLARGRLAGRRVSEVVLFDRPGGEGVEGARIVAGDICDPGQVAALLDAGEVCVFHLASVVSGEGELDFDLALRVNLDGGRNVLEACRVHGSRPRLVFSSTLAVFGGAAMPETVGDETKQTPQTTYGATKAACELLVNDYTRKGFLDGRTARLPTVIIRPGAPNLAASSFASAVFREPLAGRDYALPVGLETRMPVIGERTVAEGLLLLAEVDGARLGDDRAVGLPGLSVTVGEMVESLRRVTGDRALGSVTLAPDPAIEAIVGTWPRWSSSERARALGLPQDEDLDSIVRAYLEDHAAQATPTS